MPNHELEDNQQHVNVMAAGTLPLKNGLHRCRNTHGCGHLVGQLGRGMVTPVNCCASCVPSCARQMA